MSVFLILTMTFLSVPSCLMQAPRPKSYCHECVQVHKWYVIPTGFIARTTANNLVSGRRPLVIVLSLLVDASCRRGFQSFRALGDRLPCVLLQVDPGTVCSRDMEAHFPNTQLTRLVNIFDPLRPQWRYYRRQLAVFSDLAWTRSPNVPVSCLHGDVFCATSLRAIPVLRITTQYQPTL